jgi:outer membrane beta-barrel protein
MTRHESTSLRAIASGLALCAAVLMVSSVARAADEATTETTTPAADATTPAPATTETTPAPAGKTKAKNDLITGVPLGPSGERQEAHILIPRRERAEGKSELTLLMPIQVNGKFVDHFGSGLEYLYHFRETLAAVVGGTYYYRAVQSDFTNTELLLKTQQAPLAAEALLMQYEAHAGLELSPFYGKFAVFNSGVVQFGFYVGAGAGFGNMRVELQGPDAKSTDNPRTFGNVGIRPVGYFNTGFRMFFGEHIAVRLEVRDYMYSSSVQRINGCSYKDLQMVAGKSSGTVSDTCMPDKFADKQTDANIGSLLVQDPSSDVTNNIQVAAAFSVLF